MTSVPATLRSPEELDGGLPFLGHLAAFLRDPRQLLARARTRGRVTAFRLGPQRVAFLSGPVAQEAFFRATDAELSPREAYQMMVPIFGRGVVYDASPERMIEQFHFLIPAFQERRMRTYAQVIVEEVRESIRDWGDVGEIDAFPFTSLLVGHTSTRCLLGPEFRHELTAEFEEAYRDLEGGVTALAYLAPNAPTPRFRRRDAGRRRLERMVASVVARRLESGVEHDDFLQTLIEARYADGTRPTDTEVTGLLLAGLFSGRDTSGATAAWALAELARNPELQAAVRAEVAATDVAADPLLKSMVVTERFLKEVLRLHPPLFMLLRRVMTDLEADGHRIPAGSLVVVSPELAHRDAATFAEPDRFDPDRFAPPRKEDQHAYAYIPFGGGRHKCLGSAFAMLQLKTILVEILDGHRLIATDDPVEEDLGIMVIGPKSPLRIRYERAA